MPWPRGQDPERHFGGASDTNWLEKRLKERQDIPAPQQSVWAASPPRPEVDVLDEILAEQKARLRKREKELKKLASQDSSDSEEERRRDKKHKKSKHKHKSKSKKHKSSHRKRKRSDSSSSSSSDSYSSDSDSRDYKRRREKSKSKDKRQKKSRRDRGKRDDSDDAPATEASELIQASRKEELEMIKQIQEKNQKKAQQMDDEDVVGPLPLPDVQLSGNYGFAMRPGEADAMADFVSQNKRIPRRGEVGMSAEEIVKHEELGYVMSGSRHKRMNAVRIRKESQIYSAEEKRMLATVNLQEKAARENKIVADLREIAAEKMKQHARSAPQGPSLPPPPSK